MKYIKHNYYNFIINKINITYFIFGIYNCIYKYNFTYYI